MRCLFLAGRGSGASRVRQLEDNVATLENLAISDDELREIERVLADGGA